MRSITPTLGTGVDVEVDVVVGALVFVGIEVDVGLITCVDVWIEDGEMSDWLVGPLQDDIRKKRKIVIMKCLMYSFKLVSQVINYHNTGILTDKLSGAITSVRWGGG